MACHACYDAPCQLKLESYKGLLRGASTDKVYDGSRLLAANLTRLFEDATTTQEWRAQRAIPVPTTTGEWRSSSGTETTE